MATLLKSKETDIGFSVANVLSISVVVVTKILLILIYFYDTYAIG